AVEFQQLFLGHVIFSKCRFLQSEGCYRGALEHFPEKWRPVFRRKGDQQKKRARRMGGGRTALLPARLQEGHPSDPWVMRRRGLPGVAMRLARAVRACAVPFWTMPLWTMPPCAIRRCAMRRLVLGSALLLSVRSTTRLLL